MQSMTGYGSASAQLGEARLVVDVRALNHRFLDLRVRTSSALSEHGGWIERAARERLVRGHVEIGVRVDGPLSRDVRLDRERAKAAFQQLSELRSELGTDEPVPLSLLASVPDLFHVQLTSDDDSLRKTLADAIDEAFGDLERMRGIEGAALRRDLETRLGRVRELRDALTARASVAIDDHRTRTRERLERLLDGTGVKLDAERLEHEIVILADRGDIAEELTRLGSHTDQFLAILKTKEATRGRRLEFVLQEMAREANTIASKASDPEMGAQVIELKAELERMREQVQNVL